jgi:hypothetical protein
MRSLILIFLIFITSLNLLGQQDIIYVIDSILVSNVITSISKEEVSEDDFDGPNLIVYSRIINQSNRVLEIDLIKHILCMKFVINRKDFLDCDRSTIPDYNDPNYLFLLNSKESIQLCSFFNPLLSAGVTKNSSFDYSQFLIEAIGTSIFEYYDGKINLTTSSVEFIFIR